MPASSDRRDVVSGGARAPAPRTALQQLNAFLVSPKLAIAILVVVLACCVAGVTLVRGVRAGQLIFATLWFNGLLVLLAISSFAAFFNRIWRRKLTLVSAGMILFHLSFAALLGGIVYNQMFYFRGVLRLSEGETLPNGAPESYDAIDQGRLFSFRRFRGETTLVKMLPNYTVDGANKRAAYEIEVGEGADRHRSIIYTTEYFRHDGFRYFRLKEGFTILLVMSDAQGGILGGAFVPLQSYRLSQEKYRYAVGNPMEEYPFSFPQDRPRADVWMSFRPNTIKERDGEVELRVAALGPDGKPGEERKGRVVVGAPFKAGELTLTPREVRYWVGMTVNHDPGAPIIFGSLCTGLLGMALTFIARVRRPPVLARGAAEATGAAAEPVVARGGAV